MVPIVARDHSTAPRLTRRSEHMDGAGAANFLRHIPKHMRNNPQLGLFDNDVPVFRIAAFLFLLRFRVENC